MQKDPAINVLGDPLEPCSIDPITGFFRDGHCNTCAEDHGSHTVCVVMTAEFLAFSKYLGNDLSTPMPQYQFPGLNPGDPWCLCASRFMQAADEGVAPRMSPPIVPPKSSKNATGSNTPPRWLRNSICEPIPRTALKLAWLVLFSAFL